MGKDDKGLWEDREVRFDIPNIHKKIRGGEKVYEILDMIEDTKGNPGDPGRLIVTNIRLIWICVVNTRFTLSVGYGNMLSMNTKTVISKLKGTTQALFILTVNNHNKFEFIFTNTAPSTRQSFSAIFDIFRLYQASPLYRELKLRGAFINAGQLVVLKNEQIFKTIPGVYNLSSDQGNLGTFIITNVRVVWFAVTNESFSISMPYIQLATIKVRDSKYGPALVITTAETGGSYVLGFRIDPAETLNEVYQELMSLHSIYNETPIFGVFYEPKQLEYSSNTQLSIDDFQEIDPSDKNINTKLSAYLAEGNSEGPRQTFYCKDLGFAMEKLKDGYTIKDLWEVIPSE